MRSFWGRMGSFASKLARLAPVTAAGTSASAGRPRETAAVATAPADRAAVLDELRDRIARIVGRAAPVRPKADPADGELPFAREETELGPRYVRRVRSGPAARVGRAPLVAARFADAAMLALLALDPKLAGCDPRRALYVDTETTGLAGGTGTVPFLLGMAFFDEAANAFVLEQVLLRRLGEEAPILALYAERVRDASALVTFNGKAFDMPLLRTRFVMNRMAAPAEPPHLDLVHVARRVHGARLKVRTLASIEHRVLGRVRVGDVPGGEVVACYAHFLRTGDEGALLGVVEHNAADVLAMVALVGLYGEPLDGLGAEDLAGAARVVQRAGDLARAAELAERAVVQGGGARAHRARALVAKARGDKARALVDLEAALAHIETADAGDGLEEAAPSVRLELAKLYEHHVKAYARALEVCAGDTGEIDAAAEKRRARLRQKIEKGARRRGRAQTSLPDAEGGG
ncbi:MAG TPA: ribonuclease H-like domain-containing protein [Minicystis sp.]|nr:ribonuclease H-like domain-containing protein [Minicystis sp.]